MENDWNTVYTDADSGNVSTDCKTGIAGKAKWLDGILSKEGINLPAIIGQSMGDYVG